MRLFLFFLAPVATGAFLQLDFSVQNPLLKNIIDSHDDPQLEIHLDIGKDEDGSRLAIKGMVVDLQSQQPVEHVRMPGKNGPSPKLSAGIRSLRVVHPGTFISHQGTQAIDVQKTAWELVWRKDAPAGVLLCGFEIPMDYKRNEAVLPKGRVYLSFPLWTKETLQFAQKEKERVARRAQELAGEKQACLEKFQETSNPLMKALHLRNAYAAIEKYHLQPLEEMKHVPDSEQVFELQKDVLLTTKGLVWTKNFNHGEQVLLGTAQLSPAVLQKT